MNGIIEDYRDESGELHRIGGPAIRYDNGDALWYHHGIIHRTDGPATTYGNGDRVWYRRGRIHRTGGPAIVWWHGGTIWVVNDQRFRAPENLPKAAHSIMELFL